MAMNEWRAEGLRWIREHKGLRRPAIDLRPRGDGRWELTLAILGRGMFQSVVRMDLDRAKSHAETEFNRLNTEVTE
jgi:hypothetical protein